MDENIKKEMLRLIPHALYVLTSQSGERTAASTVSWVTQASFQPPLLALGLKANSNTYEVVKDAKAFALNILGEGQKDIAQKFFKHVAPEGRSLAGEPFELSQVFGYPVFPHFAGFVECRVLETVETGDHAVVVAEVVEAVKGKAKGPLLLSTTGWHYGG